MSVCLEAIQNDPILSLLDEEWMIFSLDSSVRRVVYEATSTLVESISINAVVESIIAPQIRIAANIFKEEGGEIRPVGAVQLVAPNTTFEVDVFPGKYFFCFEALDGFSTYNVRLYANSEGFIVDHSLTCEGANGTTLEADLIVPPPERECGKELRFEWLRGELPDGIYFSQRGELWGTFPELDTQHIGAGAPPSANLYYNVCNCYVAYEAKWEFSIRVYVVEYPEIYADADFCLKYTNNWDKDNEDMVTDDEGYFDLELRMVTYRKADGTEESFDMENIPISRDPDMGAIRGQLFDDFTMMMYTIEDTGAVASLQIGMDKSQYFAYHKALLPDAKFVEGRYKNVFQYEQEEINDDTLKKKILEELKEANKEITNKYTIKGFYYNEDQSLEIKNKYHALEIEFFRKRRKRN